LSFQPLSALHARPYATAGFGHAFHNTRLIAALKHSTAKVRLKNGKAHVILTMSRFDLARAFYSKLLPEFG
jgi:hypothetical protein